MYVILLDIYNNLRYTHFSILNYSVTEFIIILCFMSIGTLFQYNKWKEAVETKLYGTYVQSNFSIPILINIHS